MYARLIAVPPGRRSDDFDEREGVFSGRFPDGASALQAVYHMGPDIVFLECPPTRGVGRELDSFLKKTSVEMELWLDQKYDPYAAMAVRIGRGYLLVDTEGPGGSPMAEDPAEGSVGLLYAQSTENSSVALLRYEDIVLAHSQDKKTYIHTQLREYRYKGTLTQLEERLAGSGFFRCSRSALVNLKMIRQLQPWSNTRFLLVMNDSARTQVLISRSCLPEFRRLVGM